MYATRPLSLFKDHPAEVAASCTPFEGPGSGYLIVKSPDSDDVEDDKMAGCWGTGSDRETPVLHLPFPQDRVLTVLYRLDDCEGGFFVAARVQSILRRVIATGKHKGLVRACSREDDMVTCCFCRWIKDVEPRPFDPADVYQQMEISKNKIFDVSEAKGLDAALRSSLLADSGCHRLDGFQTTVIGRWYCPFYLVKEDGVAPPAQMNRSMFYEVVLEQRWETVHLHGGSKLATKHVFLDGSIKADQEAETAHQHNDGYVYFRTSEGQRLGVCTMLWERMLWEEHRNGWVDEVDDAGKFSGVESVLVEKFMLKRMDGSVAAAFDFLHLNKIRTKV
ncbi:hypothetical protein QOZ80_8AG0629880 [Eleusine coracana subsp. coracana]|nr:hypothetical protein QOZ80_8AG0629880 [Eleusine coracana subsp. coracana]